jgi:hypothetical protein
MDLLKTKLYLDKLNREFTRLNKDPENIGRLDADIMASYVRELYDALLSDEEVAAAKPEPVAPAPRKHAVHRSPAEPAFVPPQPPAPAPAPVFEETPPSAPPPVVEVAPASPPPAPAKSHHHAQQHHHAEPETLFEEKQAKEILEKLAEQPVADLKKAIALNDRLLLTRELFAGDGKAFESTIASLNSFSNMDEAKSYLIEHCVTRYLWLDKKRIEEAKKFINLVRRRYK